MPARTGILNRITVQEGPSTSCGLSRKHIKKSTHTPEFLLIFGFHLKLKGRRCIDIAMLCQGARGLTRQGTRALILARFSISSLLIFNESLDLNPCVRCASSAATNKLDVIMPPIEDFPARHIGELMWKQLQ